MTVISFKITWWHGEHDPDKSPASWNYLGIAGTKAGWHLKPISVPCRLFRGWPCGLILNVSNQTHNSSRGLLSLSRLDVCILFLHLITQKSGSPLARPHCWSVGCHSNAHPPWEVLNLEKHSNISAERAAGWPVRPKAWPLRYWLCHRKLFLGCSPYLWGSSVWIRILTIPLLVKYFNPLCDSVYTSGKWSWIY